MEITRNHLIIGGVIVLFLIFLTTKEYFNYTSNSDQLQQDLYMTSKELEQTKDMLDNIDKLAQKNHENHINTINQLKAENQQIKDAIVQKEQENHQLKLQQAVVPLQEQPQPQMKPLLNVMAQSSIKGAKFT